MCKNQRESIHNSSCSPWKAFFRLVYMSQPYKESQGLLWWCWPKSLQAIALWTLTFVSPLSEDPAVILLVPGQLNSAARLSGPLALTRQHTSNLAQLSPLHYGLISVWLLCSTSLANASPVLPKQATCNLWSQALKDSIIKGFSFFLHFNAGFWTI